MVTGGDTFFFSSPKVKKVTRPAKILSTGTVAAWDTDKASQRENRVPSRSNSVRHHPQWVPSLASRSNRLRRLFARVFDDIPICSQLFAGTLYAQLPLSQPSSSLLVPSSTDIRPSYFHPLCVCRLVCIVSIRNVSIFLLPSQYLKSVTKKNTEEHQLARVLLSRAEFRDPFITSPDYSLARRRFRFSDSR